MTSQALQGIGRFVTAEIGGFLVECECRFLIFWSSPAFLCIGT